MIIPSRARELLRASVLEETGKVLIRTAPGEAFCAGVMSALPTGGPLVAGAATFKLSLMSKVSLAWLGPVGGFASAVGGVLWRHRREMRRSRDERERHDLRRLREPNAGGDGGNEGGRPPDASVAQSRCPDGRRLRLDHGGALRSLVSPNRRPKEGFGGGGGPPGPPALGPQNWVDASLDARHGDRVHRVAVESRSRLASTDDAAHLPRGRLLFRPGPAGALAVGEPRQPHGLHGGGGCASECSAGAPSLPPPARSSWWPLRWSQPSLRSKSSGAATSSSSRGTSAWRGRC